MWNFEVLRLDILRFCGSVSGSRQLITLLSAGGGSLHAGSRRRQAAFGGRSQGFRLRRDETSIEGFGGQVSDFESRDGVSPNGLS
jgi:hypothetical protein